MARALTVSIARGSYRAKALFRRDALIQENLNLVPPIAWRVHLLLPPSFELDDLVSEGKLGLLHAATRYRPRQHGGTPFSALETALRTDS